MPFPPVFPALLFRDVENVFFKHSTNKLFGKYGQPFTLQGQKVAVYIDLFLLNLCVCVAVLILYLLSMLSIVLLIRISRWSKLQ